MLGPGTLSVAGGCPRSQGADLPRPLSRLRSRSLYQPSRLSSRPRLHSFLEALRQCQLQWRAQIRLHQLVAPASTASWQHFPWGCCGASEASSAGLGYSTLGMQDRWSLAVGSCSVHQIRQPHMLRAASVPCCNLVPTMVGTHTCRRRHHRRRGPPSSCSAQTAACADPCRVCNPIGLGHQHSSSMWVCCCHCKQSCS